MSRITGTALPHPAHPEALPPGRSTVVTVTVLILITVLVVRGYPPSVAVEAIAAAGAAAAQLLRRLGVPSSTQARTVRELHS